MVDECVVALEASKILRNAMEKVQQERAAMSVRANPAALPSTGVEQYNDFWGTLGLFDCDVSMDFGFPFWDVGEIESGAALESNAGLPGMHADSHE